MLKIEFEEILKKNQKYDPDILSDYLYHSYDGVFIVDKNGKLIIANDAVIEMIGVSYNELIGNKIGDIIDSGAYVGSPSLEAMRVHKVYTGMVKTRSGVEIMSTSRPIYNESGELQYVITNCRPLSVIKSFLDKYGKKEGKLLDETLDRELPKTKYVYSSNAMQEILKKSAYAAKTECAIMLLGQTGTGKGVMARFIHENSPRANKKFIEINCAALPENLLESELFGYEKGAFTGASNEGKKGLLEIADGGTVFLDEIGEMAIRLQAKLLKVLDSGYLLRVGGTIYRKINVRLLSATNRNLRQMMKDGTFREDLFYRLNVITINMPPLKDRMDELVDIAGSLLQKYNEIYSVRKEMTKEALAMMSTYSWPGNIRQLDNFIQRAVVLSMENMVIHEDLIADLLAEEIHTSSEEFSEREEGEPQEEESLKSHMEKEEIRFIKKSIREAGGSVSKAAEKLGVHRTTLYKKLESSNCL